jgi:hypothetical protein
MSFTILIKLQSIRKIMNSDKKETYCGSLKLIAVPDVRVNNILDHGKDIFFHHLPFFAHLAHSFSNVSVNALNGRHNVLMIAAFHFVQQKVLLPVKVVRNLLFQLLHFLLLAFVVLCHFLFQVIQFLLEWIEIEHVLFQPYALVLN